MRAYHVSFHLAWLSSAQLAKLFLFVCFLSVLYDIRKRKEKNKQKTKRFKGELSCIGELYWFEAVGMEKCMHACMRGISGAQFDVRKGYS